ncbi:MAG: metallophosphoesterase [Bacillota bacterium]|nr:metallophosphoesterase [Bacillota bacterium]
MSIYAIADLHLSFTPGKEKPMDIFGPRWHDHAGRLKEHWCREIKEEDTVIVAGDISWALKLEEAKFDLDWVDDLPGHKVFLKGNHDLWWNGITRLNRMYDSITFLQNDCYFAEGIYICGSRGWITPDNEEYVADEDEKIYKREMLRLEASLQQAEADMKRRSAAQGSGKDWDLSPEKVEKPEILGVLHYPPVSKPAAFSGFQQLFEDHGVKRVIYGHIHGEEGFQNTIMGDYRGIRYQLVSLDYLNCKPLLIKE